MLKWLLLICPLFLSADWAEETLARMSLEQKIGQLFVAPAAPLRKEDHWADWLQLLKDCHVGNAIVQKSDPINQILFLNRLQAVSEIPFLVTADAEWGLAMRMSETIAFPKNMTLGAIEDVNLIYELGREIGRQARLVGVHMNLAPVADVNCNPANPVIHMRSFGEDPVKVADRVSAFIRGMQMAGTLACAKHFPGHGDTNVDSHHDLPVIDQSMERMLSVELVPFERAVREGVYGLMMAHLYVPVVDPVYPTSLSLPCVQLARVGLHFDRLVISDALNMKAVADRYSPEEIAVLARKAGCDLLLYANYIDPLIDSIMRSTIPRAFQALKQAYLMGELDLGELDASVLRILRSKEHVERCLATENVMQALHTEKAMELKKVLFQKAVTLVGAARFPIGENTAYWSVGTGDVLSKEFPEVGRFDQIVIAVHQKEALTEEVLAKIDSFGEKAIICLFTSPYELSKFQNQTVLVAYENDPDAQFAVLDVLRGIRQGEGHLPVTVDGH